MKETPILVDKKKEVDTPKVLVNYNNYKKTAKKKEDRGLVEARTYLARIGRNK